MWYLYSLLILFTLVTLCTVTGRIFCMLLPHRMRPSCKLYLSPCLGMAFFVFFATLVGWTTGFRNHLLLASSTLIFTLAAFYCETQKKKLLEHLLILNSYALLSSGAMFFCILRYDTFNPFNDIFTYLVHGQWLQNHAFSEMVEASGSHPALTQIFLYQVHNLRMGGSFVLGWIQSLFGAQWSYTVYPATVTLALVAGSLAVGYCASLCGFKRRWHGFLIGLFSAVSFNGLAYSSATAFLPMSYGLAFAVSFLGLIGGIWASVDKSRNGYTFFLWTIPAAMLFAALVYSYSEIAPFTAFACMLAGFGFLLITKTKKQFILSGVFFLLQSIVLLNREIFRAFESLLVQSKAVVGWAVSWSILDFVCHAFGLRSGSGDDDRWLLGPEFLTLGLFFFLLIPLALFSKKIFQKRARALLPCAGYVLVSILAFFYFRYAVLSPWPAGVGQSWSQFKIANWVGPFCLVFVGISFLYAARRSRVYAWSMMFVLVVCILVGLVQNYDLAPSRTRPIRKETGYDRSSFEIFLKLRDAVKNTIAPGQSIYLDLEGTHHKIRQMVAYFLWDFRLAGNWSDDGYLFPHLPAGQRRMNLSTSDYLIVFQDGPSTIKNVQRFGNLILMKTPPCLVQLFSVKGGYDKEMQGADWWYWTPDYLTLRYKVDGKTMPEFGVVEFQYLSLTAQTIYVTILERAHEEIISRKVQPGWSSFKADIPFSGPEISIKLASSEPPIPIADTDSRLAKFMIKNVELIPKGCKDVK